MSAEHRRYIRRRNAHQIGIHWQHREERWQSILRVLKRQQREKAKSSR